MVLDKVKDNDKGVEIDLLSRDIYNNRILLKIDDEVYKLTIERV
jgi:hypothetical protein